MVVHRFHLELSHRPRAQHLQRERITERTPAAPDQGPERGVFAEMLHRYSLEAASARAAVDSGVALDMSACIGIPEDEKVVPFGGGLCTASKPRQHPPALACPSCRPR